MMTPLTLNGLKQTFRYPLEADGLNSFEFQILIKHLERPYLIPLLRERDEALELVYDLSSAMTLAQWLRSIAGDYLDLLHQLDEVTSILDQAPLQLLRLNQFMISMETLYYHVGKKRMALIYLPTRSSGESFERSWYALMEELTHHAAMSLKTEGYESYIAFVDYTRSRHEKQGALLKTLRAWFQNEAWRDSAAEGTTFPSKDSHMEPTVKGRMSGQGLDHQPGNSLKHEKGTFWSTLESKVKGFGFLCRFKTSETLTDGQVTKVPESLDQNTQSGAALSSSLLNKESESFGKPPGAVEQREKPEFQRRTLGVSEIHLPECPGTTLLCPEGDHQGRLLLQNGQGCRVFELTKPVTRLGRNTNLCDVVIQNDITVGRLHAEIHHIERHYFLKDLESLNGTYLNDQKLESHTLYKLRGNDRLRLSELELVFV